jgi:hypothetical protein
VVRPGAQAAVWFAAGVAPFVRFAEIAGTGGSVEVGLAVPLPTLRW